MERPKLNLEKIGKLNTMNDYLDKEYGKVGTKIREDFHERADAYCTGQILKSTRKDAGITQKQLADRLGMDKAYLSRIENGKIEPKVFTFSKILGELGFYISLQPV